MKTKKKPQWSLWKNRPKWAKPLDARLWKHLVEDAFDRKPTLSGVKRNRAGQLRDGIRCFDCEAIARHLGLEK